MRQVYTTGTPFLIICSVHFPICIYFHLVKGALKLFELEKFDTKLMRDRLYTLINVFRTSHHVELSKDS